MEVLQTPLEALVFRYTITAVGSLWTWLAVLTAALGFWRIRTVGSKSDAPPPPTPAAPAGPELAETQPAPPAPQDSEPVVRSPPCHVECDVTTKGRFTAYYYECSHVEDSGDREGDGISDVDREEGLSGGWGWEGMGIRWKGDLGWYRYQDLTALDGSVVRLWDDNRNVGLTLPQRRG